MAKQSRVERAEEEERIRNSRLPPWWKNSIFICLTYSIIGGSLYTSGIWSAQITGCTVGLTALDSFMSDSVIFMGILGLFFLIAAFPYLEKR